MPADCTLFQGLGLGGRQSSGLQAALAAATGASPNGLSRSESLTASASHTVLEGMPLPRTPSLPGTAQPTASQSGSFSSPGQLH